MGWIVGFEPTHNGATTRCLNHLTIPTILEATPGFEPGNKGFADLCLTTWLCRLDGSFLPMIFGDPERARTVDLQRDRLAF